MIKPKLALLGSNSLLATQLTHLGFDVYQFGRQSTIPLDFTDPKFKQALVEKILTQNFSLYVINAGYLQSTKIEHQNFSEIKRSFFVNAAGPVISCQLILQNQHNARIFIIGSESGLKGSYDFSYAMSKSALSVYVKNRTLSSGQQLLMISPSTIDDFGMTLRREDQHRLKEYSSNHPKSRFLHSYELSELISALYSCSIYLTNTDIQINGGKFASST